MAHDLIFQNLRPEILEQVTEYLKWDPIVSTSPARLLSNLNAVERRAWLHSHRFDLEGHISWVGTPIFSYALGSRKE